MAYPAGGKAGEDLIINFVGDVAGPISQSIKLPIEPAEKLGVFAEQNKEISPSPCFVRVSPFANVMESEPNNDASTATKATTEAVSTGSPSSSVIMRLAGLMSRWMMSTW